MKRLHYLSGLIITIFVSLHLFNHTCSIFGADRHISVMATLRLFYRNMLAETILLIAVFVQIISGLKLFRTARKKAVSNFEKLHIWTGLYLVIFLIIHLSAVLLGRFFLHLDTNFYFGATGFNAFPINLFFIPYYALAIFSFFGHIASVHVKKMKHVIFGFTPIGQAKGILIFGICLTIIIFYGFTNHFKGVQIPAEYNILTGK